jgi:Short C-terminal domain
MRAAVVGGTAYAVGKHVQGGRDDEAAGEADQEARLEALESQQPAAAAPPSGGLTDDAIDQLQKLAELQKAGVLTQEEFDDQKRKLLQSA